MALIGETDSRPGLIGYEEINKPLYSPYEVEKTKEIMKEYKQKKIETVLDLTLNEIIDNIANMTGDFTNDYMLKIHEVNLKSINEGEETFLESLKKYLVAFMLYLGSKNNLIYFGFILIFLSIILYFFNITSQ